MSNPRTLGPWLRRFLAEYIVTERNLARNTQKSYRDTFALLLPFVGALALCDAAEPGPDHPWRANTGLIAFPAAL